MRNDIYNRLHNEPYPCQHCQYKEKCATEELACRRFLWYINEERWVCAEQDEPNEKLFQMVFDPNTEMFKNDNTIMFDIKHLSIEEKRKEIEKFNPFIYVFGYELQSKPWLNYEERYV